VRKRTRIRLSLTRCIEGDVVMWPYRLTELAVVFITALRPKSFLIALVI